MGMSLEEALKILEDYSFEQRHSNGGNYTDFLEAIDTILMSFKDNVTYIKTSDGKEYNIENDCLIRKSEAIRQIYEKSLRIDNPDTQNGLAGAVAILCELKGEQK